MNLKWFEKAVKAKFHNLTCQKTTTRNGSSVYAITDWTVVYDIKEKVWNYNESKSTSGSGKTLDEAISNCKSDVDFYDYE